ncbi:DNA N-6-adenine-methyltransferase [Sphingomonas liriopis]|uniref:DNA N-6-adenine-methyltransferase n=1 Tax=Sphingomonas liriopis TaxID=2949094 RepID=UPI003BF4F202
MGSRRRAVHRFPFGRAVPRRAPGGIGVGQWEASGQTDDWWTPPVVFDALGCRFDTDVSHPGDARCCVPAQRWIMTESLDRDWADYGFIWMNPPFGGRNALSPWLGKFFEHRNGIALTPDRTSAPWFHAAWRCADAVLFTRKLRFLRPDGSEGVSPANGTALWACGGQAVSALHRAAHQGFGIFAVPA